MIKHKRDAVTLGDVKNIHFNTMKRPSKDDSKAQDVTTTQMDVIEK